MLIKSLLLVLVKSHNLVFSRVVIFLGFQIRKQTSKTNFFFGFLKIRNEQTKQKETKQNKNNKVKRLVMRDSPCEDVLDSPATAPEKVVLARG